MLEPMTSDPASATAETAGTVAAPVRGAARGTSHRLAGWLVSGPPLAYLLVFFAIPSLIMVVASFRFPGDFGGLAPLF